MSSASSGSVSDLCPSPEAAEGEELWERFRRLATAVGLASGDLAAVVGGGVLRRGLTGEEGRAEEVVGVARLGERPLDERRSVER